MQLQELPPSNAFYVPESRDGTAQKQGLSVAVRE
jgi:hypothetical protein